MSTISFRVMQIRIYFLCLVMLLFIRYFLGRLWVIQYLPYVIRGVYERFDNMSKLTVHAVEAQVLNYHEGPYHEAVESSVLNSSTHMKRSVMQCQNLTAPAAPTPGTRHAPTWTDRFNQSVRWCVYSLNQILDGQCTPMYVLLYQPSYL
jgi:hypothetical protein